MKALFNQSFEKVINGYLSLDPESSQRLLALDNKTITIELLAISITLHLAIQDGKMYLKEELIEPPDVLIKGTPLSLIQLSLSEKNRKKLFTDDIQIEGNLELGQQILDLFDALDIDWEEYLSLLTGDVAAHQVGRFLKGANDVVQRLRESLLQNINEYVHEEANFFPPAEALHDFFQDIDILRMDVDRLEANIKRLKKNKEELQ